MYDAYDRNLHGERRADAAAVLSQARAHLCCAGAVRARVCACVYVVCARAHACPHAYIERQSSIARL